jgi:hypothetical protein
MTVSETPPVPAGGLGRVLRSDRTRVVLYFMSYLFFGMFGGAIGPSVPVFAAALHIHPEELGIMFLFRGLGFIAGCLGFGAA